MAIQDGMTLALGGFTPAGYPKVIPGELVKRKAAGEALTLNLITSANVGAEIEADMGRAGIIARTMPLQGGGELGALINRGKVHYVEAPLHKTPRLVQTGVGGKIDVAVIEAVAVTEEGYIVPSFSVGLAPHFAKLADTVIVELNCAQPEALQGIHDIYLPALPPNRQPIPLTHTNQRIGEPFIRVNPDKIKYIVESNQPDTPINFAEASPVSRQIANHLLNFLELEAKNRLGNRLLPIQSGMGNLANNLVREFKQLKFNDLEFYCGILQEANIELIVAGKVKAASGNALSPSPKVMEIIRKDGDLLKQIMVLRPTDITNNAEIIDRLGVIALNNAIEIDIYGNANTTHVMGSQVVTGIGGGGAFTQNAYLSVMLLPSEMKGGAISTIVPMLPNTDISEHDIDVIITENGVADLRGKDPLERANAIINNCAGSYKQQLKQYLAKSIAQTGGHQPQLLSEAFAWHLRLKATGTMKEAE
jgi:succinyl-CoA:acetate CoA-transferase